MRVIPHCWRALRLAARRDGNRFAVNGDGHVICRGEALRALGALHFDRLAGHGGGDPRGQLDRLLTNTRHVDRTSLEYRAEHFAADIGRACIGIRHHALGRRDDGHAETLTDLRNVIDAEIDAAPGLETRVSSRMTGAPS